MSQLLPFFSNTSNDLRCAQATLKMILHAEGQKISLSRLDDLTYRHGNEWTWNPAAMSAMRRLGFDGILYEPFNYQIFARRGEAYLKLRFGQEWTDREMVHTNISTQQRLSHIMVKDQRIVLRQRRATMTDIQRLFRQGWYIAPSMNAVALQGRSGYVNHVVIITNIDSTSVTLHDPGLPPRKNWKVSRKRFEKAFTGVVKAWKNNLP